MSSLVERIPSWLLLAGVICLYLLCSGMFFFSYLPPQTDEELFAEPSLNLATEGSLVSHVVLGMDKGVFWQPPLYFLVLSAVVGTFGYSLGVVRGFSLVLGAISLVLTYLIAGRFVDRRKALLLSLLLSLDPFFVLYAKMGRMDSLAVVFILGSLLLAIWAFEGKSLSRWFIAGLAASAAAVTHPLGLSSPVCITLWLMLVSKARLPLRKGAIAAFLAPAAAVSIIWALSAYAHRAAFVEQMAFQFARKDRNLVETWGHFGERFKYLPVLGVVAFLCALSSARRLWQGWRSPTELMLIDLALVILLPLVASTYEFSYQIYLQPFLLILVGYSLFSGYTSEGTRRPLARKTIVAALVLNFCLYWGALRYEISAAGIDGGNEIALLFDRVSAVLPRGSHVLTIGSPSLYWDLRSQRPDVEFVSNVFLTDAYGREAMRCVDRVVLTRSFSLATDDQWHRSELRRLRQAATAAGRRLVEIAAVGTRQRFAYSALVYQVDESRECSTPER
jgi:4-amino-4-deoxy-L-arabinose transferase-like glycosyltransferase